MADEQDMLMMSVAVIAIVASRRRKRRKVRSCWVRSWISNRSQFGGYEALLKDIQRISSACLPGLMARALLALVAYGIVDEY